MRPLLTKRIAIYARTSTADDQSTENQIRELRVVAERHGWNVAAVFDDLGVSGGLAREDRPAMNALLRTVALGWRQETMAENAREVQKLGSELYERLRVMTGHLQSLQRSLTGTVEA